MRFRKRSLQISSLTILLLAVSYHSPFALALSDTPSSSNADPQPLPRAASALGADTPPVLNNPAAPQVQKSDKGTRDAPVDGQDGKPHAGPFVKPFASVEDEKHQAPPRNSQPNPERPLAEDGVMNDRNRQPPRKGTTGTEGGVSEKEKNRIAQESVTGQKLPMTPDSPKQHVSGPDQAIKGTEGETKVKNSKTGGVVLEKPVLPAKDYPDVNIHTEHGSNSDNHIWDWDHDHDSDDDDDDDDDEEDGIHDIIPWDSLAGSFSTIAATEIGDKTFIVAALMAMRHSRIQVFSAAFTALFIMTILSGVLGHALGAIISKRWSALVAALLFLVFGAKSVREGLAMSPDQGVSDEIREVEAELEEKEEDMVKNANGHGRDSAISPYALEAGRAGGGRRSRSRSRLAAPRRSPSSSSSRSRSRTRRPISSVVSGFKNLLSLLLSPAWVETFSMTFVGELGDRSQIATVAMAAGQEYFWVMVGASLGHFVCTGVAVLGGSVLAGRVSLRKVTLIGGAIFLMFGFFTLLEAVQYWHGAHDEEERHHMQAPNGL